MKYEDPDIDLETRSAYKINAKHEAGSKAADTFNMSSPSKPK